MNASLLCIALGLASDPAALQTLYAQSEPAPYFLISSSATDGWVGARAVPATTAYAAYSPDATTLVAAQPPTYGDGAELLSPPGAEYGGVAPVMPGYGYPQPQPGYAPFAYDNRPYWYPSDWTIYAGAIFLKRDSPSSVAIINSPPGVEAFNASSFDFGYEPGFEVSLAHLFAPDYEFEFRYFNISDWNDTQSFTSAAGGSIGTNPPTPFAGVAFISLSYDSDLQGLEANIRRPINPALNLFAGFRWVSLDEDLRANFTFAGPLATYNVNTNNDLYGLQIGADGTFWNIGWLRMEYFGKVGLFANDASQDSTLVQVGPPVFGSASDSGSETAFLAELGLTGVVQISPHWSLRGGYRLMWIDGVALAADQIPNTGIMNAGPTTSSLDTSTAFYHGAHVGLELCW